MFSIQRIIFFSMLTKKTDGITEDLELVVDMEYDLVDLAQDHYNKNGNRSIINDTIFDEFSRDKVFDENHKIIAWLPILTYWTTNYGSLYVK